jgi:prevent-host-death family protein
MSYYVQARTDKGGDMTEQKNPMTKIVQATEARQQLPQLLNTVHLGKTRVVVERSGIPVAAIVSMSELQRLEQLDQRREQLFKAVTGISDKFKDVPQDELEREVAKAVSEARAEMREERAAKSKKGRPVPQNP